VVYFLILSLFSPSIKATCNDNFCNDATAPGITDRSDWMSYLIDQLQLKDFSMPGTHDSGTFGSIVNTPIAAAWADCQVWGLDVQLKSGLRFFDWRLQARSGSIYICHNDIEYDVTWTSILDTTTAFLSNHKSETLIFRLGFTDVTRDFFNTITSPYVNAGKIVFFEEDRIPQLIHVRGQIIILVGDSGVVNGLIMAPGENNFLMNSNMAIEDIYDGETVDTKIDYVRGDRGINGPSADPHRWHISYSSFSYWIYGTPEELAAEINAPIYNTVQGYSSGKNIGVLVMDFPGNALIGSIINTNTGLDTIAQCCFYTDINYGGSSFCIQSDTSYVGDSFNDKISSWNCSDGRYAIIYKDKNYGGDKYLTECRGKESSNENWNDQISSIKLKYCDQDYQYSTKYCTFFVDSGWQGESVPYSGNQVTVALNDKFSSWDCDPGMGAIIYQDDNYGGLSSTISCGTRQAEASKISFQDNISSVKVYKCPYCCFYTEDNYQGNYFCTANDILNLSPVFKSTITSWRCTTNAYATLTWEDSNHNDYTYQTSCGENTVHNDKAIIKIQIHTCSGWSAMIEEEITETSSGVHTSSRFGLLLPWQIGLIVAAISTIFIAIIVVILLWKRRQQSILMNDESAHVEMSK